MGRRKEWRELICLVFWGAWTGSWLYFTLHYYEMLSLYASIDGFYLDHPVIYAAVEAWLLVSLLALMFATYRLTKFATAPSEGP